MLISHLCLRIDKLKTQFTVTIKFEHIIIIPKCSAFNFSLESDKKILIS